MVALLYALAFIVFLWWGTSKVFGLARGTHLTIFAPTAAILVAVCTVLGLLISTATMSEAEYIRYWHSFNPGGLTTGLTVRILESSETFIELMWLPYAFVADIVGLWWYTVSTHLTIAVAVLHVVAVLILWVWWRVLEVFCGIFTLTDYYPDSTKRI